MTGARRSATPRRRSDERSPTPPTDDAERVSPPPKKISPAREKARADGIRAEDAAARHLLERGVVLIGRNVRVGRYEIDLLARDGSVIVVVEVRARGRGARVRALDSIDSAKRARLRRAAEWLWRDRFAKDPRLERVRFDCVAVTFDEADEPVVEYVRAAF